MEWVKAGKVRYTHAWIRCKVTTPDTYPRTTYIYKQSTFSTPRVNRSRPFPTFLSPFPLYTGKCQGWPWLPHPPRSGGIRTFSPPPPTSSRRCPWPCPCPISPWVGCPPLHPWMGLPPPLATTTTTTTLHLSLVVMRLSRAPTLKLLQLRMRTVRRYHVLSAEINPVENIMDSSHVKVIHNNSDLQYFFSMFSFKP